MIKVWSIQTRLMHWLLVVSFGFAFYTRNSEMMRDIHVDAGYIAGAVLAVRWLLGFLAQDFSAFRRFPPNPAAGIRYLVSLVKGHAKRYIGHNPAGALAVYSMLVVGSLTIISGYMSFNDIAFPFGLLDEDQVKLFHQYTADTWVILICGHISGVIASSLAHRENLPLAMITGNKVRRLNPAGAAHPEIVDISIPEFQRMQYIEEAAYYIAEKHGFQSGRSWDDWLEAERIIDQLIKAGKITA
jgi:cytochrome b